MSRIELVKCLLQDALRLPPGIDRPAWLAIRCQEDRDVEQEVLSLLSAHAEMERAGVPASAPEPGLPMARFGAYRAVELLGRGGMSSVFRAERADGQFDQTVALKIMAGYLVSPDFLRRFKTERQLLASLNHKHITRLLDGGVSSAGDPYLITEYVEGRTIDRYCDQRRLEVAARLRMFLQVCEAVDYAHRNLIAHRDLKPGNILVNEEGMVKLLDFGTAALQAGEGDVTVTRARLLTPRYASPEQLRGERVKIATDIFSLGVVLYELLSGAWPFGDPESLLSELNRTTGDVQAKPPASAITEDAAAGRSVSRAELSRILKGDIAPVILKALENDPARRYESVRQFAGDIENYLAGRPVQARPQAAAYRAGKFLRRRWLSVSAAALFALGLSAATVVAVHQAQVARAETAKARAEALKSEKASQFLNDMLGATGNHTFNPRTFTVEQMLEAAEPKLEKSWKDDPPTKATLQLSLGYSYLAIDRRDRAQSHLENALATFEALGDQKGSAGTLRALALLAVNDGRPEAGVQLFEQALQKLKYLGKDAPPLLVFHASMELANVWTLYLNQRRPECRILFDEAIALATRDISIPRADLASAIFYRAGVSMADGNYDEAEALYKKSLAMGRQEDPGGFGEIDPLFGLTNASARKGDFAAAKEFARQRYEVAVRFEGPDHVDAAVSKMIWARHRAETGEIRESVNQLLEAMPVVRKAYRSPSLDLWVCLAAAASILNRAQRFRDAEPYARELLAVVDAAHLTQADSRRAESLLHLGHALRGGGRYREATDALEKCAAVYERAGPQWAKAAGRIHTMLNPSGAR